MKRPGRLRAVSPKRRRLNAVADEWREKFVAIVGQCELCNRDYSLSCHEISAGTYARRKSLMEPACILVLCNAPHGIRQSCHSVVGVWPREKQLALLLLRRGMHYDLDKYHAIVGHNMPTQADVDGWVRQLLSGRDPGTPQPNWR